MSFRIAPYSLPFQNCVSPALLKLGRAAASLGFFAGCLACGAGPLAPETPKTEPEKPAPVVSVAVHSTAPAAASVAPTQTAPAAASAPAAIVVKGVGFETPESVLYLADLNCYLVSNIHGGPLDVDNNGFISKLSLEGEVQQLKFIEGGQRDAVLNAPKGMARVGNTLYVTDINAVRSFDLETGKTLASIPFPNATFLNDITAGSGEMLYVTDSGLKMTPSGLAPNGTDTVYKLAGKRPSVLAKGTDLSGPNGVQVNSDGVWVVGFGKNQLLRLDAKGKVAERGDLAGGGLDGLVALPSGKFLVSSWQTQSIYYGDIKSGFQPVAEGLTSPADIAWDEKNQRVAVPLFTKNEVHLLPLSLTP
jgi:hypothetical protein